MILKHGGRSVASAKGLDLKLVQALMVRMLKMVMMISVTMVVVIITITITTII